MRDKIATYIRAKYPCLWVRSLEERRVVADLRAVAESLSMRLRFWSIASGLDGDPSLVDPQAALAAVDAATERSLVVLADYHPYLAAGNAPTIRTLRELCGKLKARPKDRACSLVIVAPSAEVPPELRAEIVVLDYPLPTAADLEELVAKTATARKINLTDDERRAYAGQLVGVTYDEANDAVARSLIISGGLSPTVLAEEKRRAVERDGVLEWIEPDGGLDSVGGLEVLKAWLIQRREAASEQARAFGLPPPRGALLVGLPGCGKSLCARAVGLAWGCPTVRLDMGRLMSKWQGESEASLRRVFALLKVLGRCVLWIDEIEKALTVGSGETDGGVSNRMLGALLTWMQESRDGTFILATANKVESLPPELLRKGRWDECFFVDLPTATERREIVSVHLRKRSRDPASFNLDGLVQRSEGLTGAEIEAAIVAALYQAFGEGAADVTSEHVWNALAATVPITKTAPEKIRAIREWCASGKARPASEADDTTTTSRFDEIEGN